MYGMLTNFTSNQYNLALLVNVYGYMFMLQKYHGKLKNINIAIFTSRYACYQLKNSSYPLDYILETTSLKDAILMPAIFSATHV